ALFVMAKAPRAGAVKTRLCPPLSPGGAARLYRCFLLDVLEMAAEVPGVDPVVAYAPASAGPAFARLAGERFALMRQEGADLGARLEHGFRTLFAAGYHAVAALSTDSPDLPPGFLLQAFAQLHRNPVVLGPCLDGGYYLIGLTRLIPEVFRHMPWSTPRVLPETEARLARLGVPWARLPAWHDVDTAADLDRLIHELRDHRGERRAPRTAAFCARQLHASRVPA
ncbi:MAG: TIGR04282 family arsenosugar biosynthesis glycosyltransferase, partial [Candidatus Methylomirabilales bacterium]